MKLKQRIAQYFGSTFGESWSGKKQINPKITLIISLFFVVQYSNGQYFQGYDTTNSNSNCYECFAIEELFEDGIGTLDCGRIQSTAEVSISFECKTLGVQAAGIKLTDGLRARAGCETIFKALPLPPGPPERISNITSIASEVVEIDRYEDITISPGELDGFEIYHWYDNEGNLIFQGKDLHIANAVEEKYTLRVIDADGFIGYKDVEIKLKPNRLETLFPNPANTGNLNIKYKINEANSAYIMIFSYYMSGGISNNYIVDMNVNEKNIDISSLPFGLYKVALVTDGQIVDVKILSKL